jgi:Cu-Zn family superoxide dismutase
MSAVAYFPEHQSNKVAGNVIFEPSKDGVIVRAYFSQLPPGEHGFHIHKAGDLRGEGCKGACDHYHIGPPADHGDAPNPKKNEPRHTGDLGNISKAPYYKLYELKGVDINDLYGRSVIVHADPDDLGKGHHEDSKTTGHSGARIACSIIGRVNTPNCAPPQSKKSPNKPNVTRKLHKKSENVFSQTST